MSCEYTIATLSIAGRNVFYVHKSITDCQMITRILKSIIY